MDVNAAVNHVNAENAKNADLKSVNVPTNAKNVGSLNVNVTLTIDAVNAKKYSIVTNVNARIAPCVINVLSV
jgi:hypothetical protein